MIQKATDLYSKLVEQKLARALAGLRKVLGQEGVNFVSVNFKEQA